MNEIITPKVMQLLLKRQWLPLKGSACNSEHFYSKPPFIYHRYLDMFLVIFKFLFLPLHTHTNTQNTHSPMSTVVSNSAPIFNVVRVGLLFIRQGSRYTELTSALSSVLSSKTVSRGCDSGNDVFALQS